MKKIETLLLLSILLVWKNHSAQVIIESKENTKPKPTFAFQKISASKNGIYILGVDDDGEKSTYFIEKYNSSNIELEYQKNLNICDDDKLALVHPLFTPPIVFERNDQIVVFYTSYNKSEKTTNINLKVVNEKGEIKQGFVTLISSPEIEVQMDGMYWNLIGYYKPVINYYLSEDKSIIIIEIDSPKFKKIHLFKLNDLVTGKSEHKSFDVLNLCNKEKLKIERCFYIKNKLCFTYNKNINDKKDEFGFAVYDEIQNKFNLTGLKLSSNHVFSSDYLVNKEGNVFISGYQRTIIDNSKPLDAENSKIKMFNVIFNTSSYNFENKNEFEFVPNVSNLISKIKSPYGFINKNHSADQYLEKVSLIESTNYYFHISQLIFGKEPYFATEAQRGGGVTTVSRDILVSKFDKSGKLINQYLLPRHTQYNTYAGSRSGSLWAFTNKQRNSNFLLKDDDLHFFYFDHGKNTYNPLEIYDPNNTRKCDNKSALVHYSLKSDAINREMLYEVGKHKVYFYSNQNLTFSNYVFLDIEEGRKSSFGRAIVN